MTSNDWVLIVGIVTTVIGAVVTVYVTLSSRLTRIETIFEFVGLEALKTLHSDDDHLGLDRYIDTITEEYNKHHYDLSDKQWEEFNKKLDEVNTNPKSTALEKATAKFVKALCEHKLMRSGFMKYQKVTETLTFND